MCRGSGYRSPPVGSRGGASEDECPTWQWHQLDHMHLSTIHPFNGPFLGLPGWATTRKVKPIWILREQETVSGSGISWAICKSAPRSRLDNHASTLTLSFLQAGCASCRPTNSVKALRHLSTTTVDIRLSDSAPVCAAPWWVSLSICYSIKSVRPNAESLTDWVYAFFTS